MTDPAARVVADLVERGVSVAVAESLTGGLVLAALTAIPGASAAVRGGIVAYATESKHTVLGIDAHLLADRGPVAPEVAAAMAEAVRRQFGADIGLSTTGVAGPDPQDEHRVGEVYVALADRAGHQSRALQLSGTRSDIRAATVSAAVGLLAERLADRAADRA